MKKLQLETERGLTGEILTSYEQCDIIADSFFQQTSRCPIFYNHESGFYYTPEKYRYLLG